MVWLQSFAAELLQLEQTVKITALNYDFHVSDWLQIRWDSSEEFAHCGSCPLVASGSFFLWMVADWSLQTGFQEHAGEKSCLSLVSSEQKGT